MVLPFQDPGGDTMSAASTTLQHRLIIFTGPPLRSTHITRHFLGQGFSQHGNTHQPVSSNPAPGRPHKPLTTIHRRCG